MQEDTAKAEAGKFGNHDSVNPRVDPECGSSPGLSPLSRTHP